MHICFIYPFFPPGVEGFGISAFISNFCRLLSEQKDFQVSVICRTNKKDKDEIIDKIRVYRRQNDRGIKELVKRINHQKRIDLIDLADFSSFGVKIFGLKKIPVILRCHTPSWIIDKYCSHKKPIFNWNERRLELRKYKLAKYIVFSNKDAIREIKRDVKIGGRIKILSFNMFKYQYKKRKRNIKENKDNELKLIYVGRLEELKNVEILIKAVIFVDQELGMKINLTLFGPDTSYQGYFGYQNYLDKTVIKKNSKLFKFKGMIENNQLIKLYKYFDLLVMPSKYESMGYAVIEAMAQGLAVVASKVGGLKRLVDNGKTGYLYWPSDDYKELAQKLAKFVKNPKLIRRFGEAGTEKIKKNLNSFKILNENIAYYKKVIQDY